MTKYTIKASIAFTLIMTAVMMLQGCANTKDALQTLRVGTDIVVLDRGYTDVYRKLSTADILPEDVEDVDAALLDMAKLKRQLEVLLKGRSEGVPLALDILEGDAYMDRMAQQYHVIRGAYMRGDNEYDPALAAYDSILRRTYTLLYDRAQKSGSHDLKTLVEFLRQALFAVSVL